MKRLPARPTWNLIHLRYRVLGWTVEDAVCTPVGESARSRRRREGSGIDLHGRRFGRLVVIAFERVDFAYECHWRCRCDCDPRGERTVVRAQASLLANKTRSCGCLRRETSPKNGSPRRPTPRKDLGEVVAEMRARHAEGRVA